MSRKAAKEVTSPEKEKMEGEETPKGKSTDSKKNKVRRNVLVFVNIFDVF
jgi:hypothetical protein